jgi:hypothetical protein
VSGYVGDYVTCALHDVTCQVISTQPGVIEHDCPECAVIRHQVDQSQQRIGERMGEVLGQCAHNTVSNLARGLQGK